MVEKLFLGKVLEKIPGFFSHIYLLAAAVFGWVLFYYEDLSQLGICLKAMFGSGGLPLYDDITISAVKGSCFVIAAALIFCCPIGRIIIEKTEKLADKSGAAYYTARMVYSIVLLGILAVSSVLLVNQSYNPFLYFRY